MVSKIMKRCPNCGADTVVVHNVQDGSEFCPSCAPPSFDPRGILTMEDLKFMEECGIDPGLSPALKSLCGLASKKLMTMLAFKPVDRPHQAGHTPSQPPL